MSSLSETPTLRLALMRKGIPYRSAPNNHISICCLFCPERGETPDERFRLSINLATGAAYCFNCGWRRHNAYPALYGKLRIQGAYTLEAPELADPPEERPIQLPSDFQPAHKPCNDVGRKALAYAINRGLTVPQLVRKGIGISLMGRFAYRLLFPVRRKEGLAGLVGRDFTGIQEPKYLNSLGRKSLYNAPFRDEVKATRVVLSEGVFKALRIERLRTGYESMALLGKSITAEQIEQLKELACVEVVVWPDPDRPGRQGAIDTAQKLAEAGFNLSIVWPIFQPADEAPLPQMDAAWTQRQPYSTPLLWKLMGNRA